ncbi:hypothetical protein BDBG_06428 [Blastomyces gilchristii SLH14081]|uniref:Uncharacterized protein n=1 Tax=Blastomyces gilchristii (strain SLH14081) TaxID=559298 RepID=A0A179UTP3_BLAGS|nr:uncharacterized protein BDBG_06428 [Blastomyces gilchristii SLH14081]OAT10609.1 hypothetical protein BDBG_06428 [Blastomyces gilchristii SLH14081]
MPTKQELNDWIRDPQGYTGGRWKYVVLRPGRTTFLTSATIHYAPRLPKGQTLMAGGHIPQWPNIERWMETMIAQMKNPDTTNEDMELTAGKYVKAVADLIHDRDKSIGDLDKETAREFFENVKVFQTLHWESAAKSSPQGIICQGKSLLLRLGGSPFLVREGRTDSKVVEFDNFSAS